MAAKVRRRAQCGLLALLGLSAAQAQEGKRPWEEYDQLIRKNTAVAALGPTLFGDAVDLASGSLSFSATDVSLPGNNALPVAFSRRLSVQDRKGYLRLVNGVNRIVHDGTMADWELDAPRIEGTFANGWDSMCAATTAQEGMPSSIRSGTHWFQARDYWHGNTLVIPGAGSEEMLVATNAATAKPSTGGPYHWVTPGFTYFSCLPAGKNFAGQAFQAVAADGTKYSFDWAAQTHAPDIKNSQTGVGEASMSRRKVAVYATRVEDRFGNWVTYTYANASNAPARLTAIASSDGRAIAVAYNAQGHVQTVTANGRVWTYAYAYPSAETGTLVSVTLPDGSAWGYALSALSDARFRYVKPPAGADEGYRDCLDPGDVIDPGPLVGAVTHPSGAVGEFTVAPTRFGRSNVPRICNGYSTPQNDPNDDVSFYPVAWDSFALTRKRITGPGLTPAQWSYGYYASITFAPGTGPSCTTPGGCGAPVCLSDACAGTAVTSVIGPDNGFVRYTFGNSYRYNEGKLLKTEQGTDQPRTILRTTAISYNLAQSGQAYPTPLGASPQQRGDGFTAEYLRPQTQSVVSQQGATFTSAQSGFDAFARATSVAGTSSLGHGRTETTEYHDVLAGWILGQVKRGTVDGIETGRTEFHANALPWKSYAFGKLQQTLTYYADGTVATAADGAGNATTLSGWKRGIPQLIQYPATPDQPSGASQSAVVDDSGWLASVIDETGGRTCYGYDAMGRLAGITYPSETTAGVCDASHWTPTVSSFSNAYGAAYGLPAGHWRQRVTTGNALKETLYDALWRPVVAQTYDLADPAATLSQTVYRYDASGRKAFASYPQRTLDPAVTNTWGDPAVAPSATGSWTTYDALDRATKAEQDWEGAGKLTTTTEYLAGFQTRVTNPRGFQSTTGYYAYDTPSYDAPGWIVKDAGGGNDQTVQIQRDVFGKPTQIRQSGYTGGVLADVSRHYVYDAHQRLCKTVEPETGATMLGYDAADNLAWQAAGVQGQGDPAYCNASEGMNSGRAVSRTHDARHRLKTLAFPDGRGNQAWSYTPDGLPSQIATDNDGPGQGSVVNAYVYNKRRLLGGQGETLTQPGWYSWGVGYGYDANGQLASQTYPDGFGVTYLPNALGQPTRVQDLSGNALASGVSYHPNGAIAQFAYGNGIVHTMTQNARQLPLQVRSGSATGYEYWYDPHGNPTHIHDLARGGDYSRGNAYDGLDRLTASASASYGGDHWHRYTYDALDNLKSWKLAGVKDYANYHYDASNRLTNIQNTAGASIVGLGYDAQGNVSNQNGHAYVFDYGNRLRMETGVESYRYDGHGRRVEAWAPQGNILSLYGRSGQLLFEENQRKPGTQANVHVYLGGSLIATRERNYASGAVATKYQHTDALGSPVAVTDAAGAVIDRTQWEPYGAAIGKPAYQGIGYTGHAMDGATGLTYMQQRYYDQQIGRFLSVDPVTAYSSPGANFNRYWYANNNPYRFIDPDGREACGTDTTCRISSGMSAGTIGGAIAGASGSTFNSNGSIRTDRTVGSIVGVAAGGMTRDDAFKSSAHKYVPDSYKDNRESNWLIIGFSDGKFGYSTPNTGKPGQTTVPIPDKEAILGMKFGNTVVSIVIAIGHNHLRGDIKFSGWDAKLAEKNRGIPVYLWDENGKAKMLDHRGAGGTPRQEYEGTAAPRYNIQVTW